MSDEYSDFVRIYQRMKEKFGHEKWINIVSQKKIDKFQNREKYGYLLCKIYREMFKTNNPNVNISSLVNEVSILNSPKTEPEYWKNTYIDAVIEKFKQINEKIPNLNLDPVYYCENVFF